MSSSERPSSQNLQVLRPAGTPVGATSSPGATASSPGHVPISHVLVVDDDDGVRRVFARVLLRANFQVSEAADGTTALAMLAKQKFDVILSDIAMPGLSGMQFVQAVRERGHNIQVVLATGNPTLETAMRAGALGVVHYLTKPVEHALLIDVIRKAAELQRRRPTGSLPILDIRGKGEALAESFKRVLSQLKLNYQPVVSMTRRNVWGYEALLRSSEPTLATPEDVLVAAEKLNQLAQLGRRVRALAADAVALLPPSKRLLVNIHPIDLTDPELLDAGSPLSKHAGRVILEVTERASLHDPRDVERALITLRALGYGIAVDDLGAGYAGLLSLLHLRPDVVKLDMQLIRDVHQDPRRQKLVRMILSGCRDLAVEVVVEGVETREERDALTALGCDLMQGYFFGYPHRDFLSVPPDRFQ